MSREFIDDDLITWEVFSSSGRYGLPDDGRLVFLCITHPERRPRTAPIPGDAVDAEAATETLGDDRLRQLLRSSIELN